METDKSLLEEAKCNPRSQAWFTLATIYEPLIAGWIARAGVDPVEVSDISQEVLKALSVELPNFEHNGKTGAFRNWLKTTTTFRCRRYWENKKRQPSVSSLQNPASGIELLDQLEDPDSLLSKHWEAEHDRYLMEKITELVRSEFDDQTIDIFKRHSIDGESPSSIAEELGIDIVQVYKSKFRVMTRLRKVAQYLI